MYFLEGSTIITSKFQNLSVKPVQATTPFFQRTHSAVLIIQLNKM